MSFPLHVYTSNKSYLFQATITSQTNEFQQIRISGRTRSIVLENNIPTLRTQTLKGKKIHWALIEGTISNPKFLARLIEALEYELIVNRKR